MPNANHNDTRSLDAFIYAWWVVSFLLAIAAAAPSLLSSRTVLTLSPPCASIALHEEPCPLCGMTRAFVAIADGRLDEAVALNPASLSLYAGFILNALAAIVVAWARYARVSSPRRAPVLETDGVG